MQRGKRLSAVLAVWMGVGVVPAAETTVDWPMYLGPFGNGVAGRAGCDLAVDLNLAKTVWVTGPNLVGRVRVGRLQLAAGTFDGEPGSCSTPIVADGKVFCTTFRQAGTAKVEKGEEGGIAIGADDVLVAVDAATGRTVWEAVEPGGICLPGGKRTSYGPSPAYMDGVVYSLGTSGKVYAYDAKSGRKKWESEVSARKGLTNELAKAVANKGSPNVGKVLSSVLVVPGMVVVPCAGKTDLGLEGFDPETGTNVWKVAGVLGRMSTAVIVRPDGKKPLLLACTEESGNLTCIDPANGKVCWKVTGLGPLLATLAASDKTVLVNVRGKVEGQKKAPGRWGAYHFTAEAATAAWSLPEGPEYDFNWWLDQGARRKGIIRDGVVFLNEVGSKPHRFLMIREDDGKVLLEAAPGEDEGEMQARFPYTGIPRLFEDRLLCAADEAHGAAKTPVAFDQWRVKADGVELLSKNWDPPVEPGTAYEVPVDWPYANGFLYGRTLQGGLVCYDLRKTWKEQNRYELGLENGYRGMPLVPLPLRLFELDKVLVERASAYPPGEKEAALTFGKDRRFARWERADASRLKRTGDKIAGTMMVDHGTGRWPVELALDVAAGDVKGTWSRKTAGWATPVPVKGNVVGRGPRPEKFIGTPWLKEPWTVMATNPPGTVTYVVKLVALENLGNTNRTRDVWLHLDHDGKTFTRSLATCFSYNTAWHEVDAANLKMDGNRITGSVEMCLNADRWVMPNPDGGSAGCRFDLDVTVTGEELSGTYSGTLGVPLEWSGSVAGRVDVLP